MKNYKMFLLAALLISFFSTRALADYYQLVTPDTEPTDWSGTYLLSSTRAAATGDPALDYVFTAAYSDGNGYGIGEQVDVKDGVINYSSKLESYEITLASSGNGYTVAFGSNYLAAPTHNKFMTTTTAADATVFSVFFNSVTNDLMMTTVVDATTFHLRFYIISGKNAFKVYNSDMYSPVKLYKRVESSTETYTITTYVNGVTTDYSISSNETYASKIETPSLEDYTFVKWVTEKDIDASAVDMSATPSANETLYAVFTTGGNAFELVTDAASLAVGNEIIIASKVYDVALGAQTSANNREGATIVRSDNKITDAGSAVVITLAAAESEDLFALRVGEDTYLKPSSGTNAAIKDAQVMEITAGSQLGFSIDITDTEADIQMDWSASSKKNNRIQYVSPAKNWFAMFEVDNAKSPVQIYRKASSGEESRTFIDDETAVVVDTFMVETYVNGATTEYKIAEDETFASKIEDPTYAGYNFSKWVCEKNTAADAFDMSACPTEDVTLYAVFASAGAGGGYELVTDASTLAIGDEIIVAAKDYDVALGAQNSSNFRDGATITRNGTTITDPGSAVVITLAAAESTGLFALCVGENTYLKPNSGTNAALKNTTATSITTDSQLGFSIAINDTEADIQMDWSASSKKNNRIQYVSPAKNWFSMFEIDNPKSAVQIYRKAAGGKSVSFIDDDILALLDAIEEATALTADEAIGTAFHASETAAQTLENAIAVAKDIVDNGGDFANATTTLASAIEVFKQDFIIPIAFKMSAEKTSANAFATVSEAADYTLEGAWAAYDGNPASLWKMEKTAAGTYTIQNIETGAYLGNAVQDVTVTLSEESKSAFTILATDDGFFTFVSESGKAIAAKDGGNLVGDASDANASRWKPTEVTSWSHTLTIGDVEWASICLNYATIIPEGLDCYIVEGVIEGEQGYEVDLTSLECNILPAGTAILVNGAAGDYDFVFTANDDTDDDFSVNLLKGTCYTKAIAASNYTPYILAQNATGEAVLGKASVTDDSFINSANKAYFPTTSVTATPALSFHFKDATGIKAAKVEASSVIFDITGRRVVNASNGLYIINGKKFLVK